MSITDHDQLALPWDDWLRPHTHIMCSHMTSEPRVLLRALSRSNLPTGVSIELGVPFSMDAQAFPDTVDIHVMGGMGTAAALARKRPLTIDRKEYLTFATDYASGTSQADVVLVSLAIADDQTLHIGASHGAVIDAARNARLVIAEINTAQPVVNGAPWPDDIPLSHTVHCDYAPAVIEHSVGRQQQEAAIAGHLADVITDGACLQVGIGAIPAAILSALSTRKHLGIHTGMYGDALHELVECSAVDNSRKPPQLQHSVIGCVYGGESLYESVKGRTDILMAHPSVTHSLSTLQQINQFTAINSAIEVDLFGRVNAETVTAKDGTRRAVGGIGGLPAFVRGALASQGGQSIIALPALTRYDGSGRSRIVPSVTDVTLDETLVDIVVTEYGVARLRDASPQQRREQMLAICSPDVRDAVASDSTS